MKTEIKKKPKWRKVVALSRLVRQVRLFLSIVYRPATGDPGDTWGMAWRKYKLAPSVAWDISKTIYPPNR